MPPSPFPFFLAICSTPLPSLVPYASLSIPLPACRWLRAGVWGTVLKPPYRHLGEPEAPTQRNVSIRLQSLLSLPFCSGALARCSSTASRSPVVRATRLRSRDHRCGTLHTPADPRDLPLSR